MKEPHDDIFNSCHLWMLGPNTLVQLLDACGLEVVSLDRGKKRGHLSITVLARAKS